MSRDKKCVICGSEKVLEEHHITPDITIALCVYHHQLIDIKTLAKWSSRLKAKMTELMSDEEGQEVMRLLFLKMWAICYRHWKQNRGFNEKSEVKDFRQLLDIFPKIERTCNNERTRDVLGEKKRRGEPLGPPALGFKAKDKKRIAYPKELKIVKYVKALRRKKLSERAIARRLNAEGIPTKRGGSWHGSTVGYILKNPSYRKVK